MIEKYLKINFKKTDRNRSMTEMKTLAHHNFHGNYFYWNLLNKLLFFSLSNWISYIRFKCILLLWAPMSPSHRFSCQSNASNLCGQQQNQSLSVCCVLYSLQCPPIEPVNKTKEQRAKNGRNSNENDVSLTLFFPLDDDGGGSHPSICK